MGIRLKTNWKTWKKHEKKHLEQLPSRPQNSSKSNNWEKWNLFPFFREKNNTAHPQFQKNQTIISKKHKKLYTNIQTTKPNQTINKTKPTKPTTNNHFPKAPQLLHMESPLESIPSVGPQKAPNDSGIFWVGERGKKHTETKQRKTGICMDATIFVGIGFVF